MAELKSIYNDSPRGRTSSISSVRDVYTNYTRASQASIGSMTLPHDLSPNIGHSRTILTPMETLLDHSNSNSSLDDFANELGLDDDDDDYLMNREEEAGQPSNRQSIKSQSSGMSYENDISFALSLPSNHPSVPEEEYHRNSPQRDSYLSSAASEGSPSNEKRLTRRLSNDSGAVADSDSTGSSTACETKEIKQIYEPSMDTLATPTATSLKDEEDEGNKRYSGFADEIFAMFKLSN